METWLAKLRLLHPLPAFMNLIPRLAFCRKQSVASAPLHSMRKMEVLLDKRENRKLTEIHKIPFKPLGIAMIAVKPEKLALMLFSAHLYGIRRTTPFQQPLSLCI